MSTVHFHADLTQLKRLGRQLEKARIEGVPHAIRDYCNGAAFEARGEWIETIGNKLTLRNTWTVRSIRVEKARGIDIKRMSATVGSTAPYMADQEEGATNAKSGKHGVAIPTGASAGQKGAKKRTKPIRGRNYLGNLRVTQRISGTRQRRNAAAMQRAVKSGTRVAFLELANGKQGLFRINGSAKRMGKPTMLYDLTRASTVTPPSATMQTSLKALEPRLPNIAIRAVMTQLNRNLSRV
jgi:hypothetical protein